ncbi:unnamed protein product [Lampetra fluviatilis]
MRAAARNRNAEIGDKFNSVWNIISASSEALEQQRPGQGERGDPGAPSGVTRGPSAKRRVNRNVWRSRCRVNSTGPVSAGTFARSRDSTVCFFTAEKIRAVSSRAADIEIREDEMHQPASRAASELLGE